MSTNSDLPPALFLMGPTASGKTALALALVDALPCEIVSADSAMVYRGMDIGTAKPSREVQRAVPHRLIDIRDPAEPYSAAQFRTDALREMAAISARGRIPLVVGGTLLYFRALEKGLSALPAADSGVRARLETEAARRGWASLHARLAEVDPAAARRIHPNDPQRIQRALEVFELTGRGLTELCAETTAQPLPYRLTKLAVAPSDRAVLHWRIERRFGEMLAEGLEREVRGLYRRGDLTPELPSIRAVGYRQMWDYLDGKHVYEEMVRRVVIATRQLAKRQLTWLRAEPGLTWLKSEVRDLPEQALRIVSRLLKGTAGH